MLDERRKYTEKRFVGLQEHLVASEARCNGRACVYATGSFARGEAHSWSDLDLFIVGQETDGRRHLSRLDEIRVKADLIEVTQKQASRIFLAMVDILNITRLRISRKRSASLKTTQRIHSRLAFCYSSKVGLWLGKKYMIKFLTRL